MTPRDDLRALAEKPEDFAWALDRVQKMCGYALADAAVYGKKLLKGFGYPNEAMSRAQDYRALDIILRALAAAQQTPQTHTGRDERILEGSSQVSLANHGQAARSESQQPTTCPQCRDYPPSIENGVCCGCGYRPAVPPTAQQTLQEHTGWLIERSDLLVKPSYWTGRQGLPAWSADHLQAIRFARKDDAEKMSYLWTSYGTAVEHLWVAQQTPAARHCPITQKGCADPECNECCKRSRPSLADAWYRGRRSVDEVSALDATGPQLQLMCERDTATPAARPAEDERS